jgi:hypothetical protein
MRTKTPRTYFTNIDLILVAAALAGAEKKFADIEDIAVEAYRLSPRRFGWRTKPYPDLRSVVQTVADLERKARKDGTAELTRRGSTDRTAGLITRQLTSEGREAALQAGVLVAGREFTGLRHMLAHFRSLGAEAADL